jgi:hypothetical protein
MKVVCLIINKRFRKLSSLAAKLFLSVSDKITARCAGFMINISRQVNNDITGKALYQYLLKNKTRNRKIYSVLP